MTEWNEEWDESGLGGNPLTNAASNGPGGAPAPDAVSVEIYDQIYNLRGTDDAYIQRLPPWWTPRCARSRPTAARAIRCASRYWPRSTSPTISRPCARYDALAGSVDNSEDSMRSRADTLSEMLDDLLEDRRAG